MFLVDSGIRRQLLLALTEDSKLHIQEVCYLTQFLGRSALHSDAICEPNRGSYKNVLSIDMLFRKQQN